MLSNVDSFLIDGPTIVQTPLWALSFSAFLSLSPTVSAPLLSEDSFLSAFHQIQVVIFNLFCFPGPFEESYRPYPRKMYVKEHSLSSLLKSIHGAQVKDSALRGITMVEGSEEGVLSSGLWLWTIAPLVDQWPWPVKTWSGLTVGVLETPLSASSLVNMASLPIPFSVKWGVWIRWFLRCLLTTIPGLSLPASPISCAISY